MSEAIPYLMLHNALEAIEFYKTVFKAKEINETLFLDQFTGNSNHKEKVAHATILIGETRFFIADIVEQECLFGDQVHFVLEMDSLDILKTTFNKLAKEGTVLHDLKEMHWCALSGFVKDKFGISWSLYFGHK